MTPEELLAECDRSERFSTEHGLVTSDSMLVLKVPGIRYGENAQVAPGPRGRVVGHGVKETMAYVTTAKARAWLKRRGVE